LFSQGPDNAKHGQPEHRPRVSTGTRKFRTLTRLETIMATSTTRPSRNRNEAVVENIEDRVRKGAEAIEDNATEMTNTVMRSAGELAETVSSKLMTVGVDTDKMATLAKDQASELQRMIGDELRTHPMRALGIAAAVGVVVGLMTSR
jgi:ElaB/YqjD/DUF883 family membrane-anchored ribosome-binding protein